MPAAFRQHGAGDGTPGTRASVRRGLPRRFMTGAVEHKRNDG